MFILDTGFFLEKSSVTDITVCELDTKIAA